MSVIDGLRRGHSPSCAGINRTFISLLIYFVDQRRAIETKFFFLNDMKTVGDVFAYSTCAF